jgi:hypothetical protein
MRYSVLSAPIACSLALHIAVLHFGWEVFASDAGVSAPWRRPVLRANLVAARAPAPVATPVVAPLPPPVVPRLAQTESKVPVPAMPAPATIAQRPAEPPPADQVQPAEKVQSADQSQPAEMPDSAFLDPGGVDQTARPLVDPEYDPPRTITHWVVEFDLLIDATGKAVRVENVSEGAPRDIIGAVLAAFYTVPYAPARLAGQPVAIRQRFSVQPDPGPQTGTDLAGAIPGPTVLGGGPIVTGPHCVGGC